MKKILLIIPFSFIGLFLTLNILQYRLYENFKNEYKILSIRSGGIECSLFSGSTLQRNSCIRNLNLAKNENIESDLNTIAESLCTNGSGTGCMVKSSLAEIQRKIGTASMIPYNLTWPADNCSNAHGKSISELDLLTNCKSLEDYASIIKDQFTLDFITQVKKCSKFEECNTSLRSNFFFTQLQNEFLFSRNCKYTINGLESYCETLKKIIAFQNELTSILKATNESAFNSIKRFDELCLSNKLLCNQVVNQPVFLSKLMDLSPAFNIEYFDKYKLNATAGIYLIGPSKQGLSENHRYANKIFNYVVNLQTNHQEKNLEECARSKDKSFCFLSVTNLENALQNKKSLDNFCQGGDSISCSYIDIIDNSKTLRINAESDMLSIFQTYEPIALEYLKDSNYTLKYLTFLNTNRIWIISFLMVANLFFIGFFLYAFKNILLVFKFLQDQEVAKIRAKQAELTKSKLPEDPNEDE